MNKNRNLSARESKLITDFFAFLKIEFNGLTELFHKDDETIIRYVDNKAKEHTKTFKTTEIIAFVYEKQKSVNTEEIMKKVSDLVTVKLTEIQTAVNSEIEKLVKSTEEKLLTTLKDAKERKEVTEEIKKVQV